MMRIEFWGATREVTGSCYLIRIGDYRILVECGLIQGSRADEARNRDPFPFDPSHIDAVILTHAHLDHSGLVPYLYKMGYKGPIYMTAPTCIALLSGLQCIRSSLSGLT